MNDLVPYVLQTMNLSKSFSTSGGSLSILSQVNLSVKKGETIAIVGPSGVGKTTLLHILGTLDTPTSGELYINNQLVNLKQSCSLRNEQIGFIFQGFHLLEDSTALDNVLLPAYIGRKKIHKESQSYKRALFLFEALGIKDRMHFLAKFLSGGEKQRVAIARALLNDPSLILADEPTGNLDEKNAVDIHHLLISSAKQFNKTLIVVTHHPHLQNLCDQSYLLKEGSLHLVNGST